MRPSSLERGVLGAIGTVRLAVPTYARGRPVRHDDVRALLSVFNVEVHRTPDISVPAILTPPLGGMYQLVLQSGLGPAVEKYIILHEAAHVLRHDVAEPTIFHFTGPLPEAETFCDLFALAGLLDAAECTQGPEWLESRIRATVPLDDRGWQVHRISDLAPRLIRLRYFIDNGWLEE